MRKLFQALVLTRNEHTNSFQYICLITALLMPTRSLLSSSRLLNFFYPNSFSLESIPSNDCE